MTSSERCRLWRINNPQRNRIYRTEQRLKNPLMAMGTVLHANARLRSRKKGIDITITLDWILERLSLGRCEATGIPFDMTPERGNRSQKPFVPSIDRRDPSQGYTPENAQVVVWIYNVAKGSWSHGDVLRLAKNLLSSDSPSRSFAILE